eukprot:358718-Pelagomonas_calceolata.AAC.1
MSGKTQLNQRSDGVVITDYGCGVWKWYQHAGRQLFVGWVNTESKSSHAASDIMGEVKERVFGETKRRMHNQGPLSRRSAPLVIGQAFTVALSW